MGPTWYFANFIFILLVPLTLPFPFFPPSTSFPSFLPLFRFSSQWKRTRGEGWHVVCTEIPDVLESLYRSFPRFDSFVHSSRFHFHSLFHSIFICFLFAWQSGVFVVILRPLDSFSKPFCYYNENPEGYGIDSYKRRIEMWIVANLRGSKSLNVNWEFLCESHFNAPFSFVIFIVFTEV